MAVQSNFPALRPTLNLNFAGSRTVDPRITITRASTAARTNERGVLESVAAGVPRVNYDPVTLACMGLLIEESRTNYITNNTMQGAVVGSPGATPTGWSAAGTGSGITRTVVATGEEDGISYIEIRFNGTPTINNVSFGFAGINTIAAASGQAWVLSVYLRLVGGSFANTTPVLDILETDGTNGVNANSVSCVATGQPLMTQRLVGTATLSNAGTTHVQPRIRVGLTIDQPVDFTLRIGLPQLEAGGFATSVIHTAGTEATRAADVASMSGTNFSEWYRQDEGTFVVSSSPYAGMAPVDRQIFTASDGTTNNRVGALYSGSGFNATVVSSGGVFQYGPTDAEISSTPAVRALAYKAGDIRAAINGSLSEASAGSVVVPVGVNSLQLGTMGAGGHLNGYIARLAYYPKRLTNAELQALTA